MPKYYLAVDIGASGGRHILGHLEDGKLILEDVYRFENRMIDRGGQKVWDTEELFGNILAGLKRCAELEKLPSFMGIDTWGVDYVLVDPDGRRVGEAVGYRDSRTEGMDREVERVISEEELYARTGIAKAPYNTIYQLAALKAQHPEELEAAESLLFSPDYYSFLLTGKRATEYTIASTSALVGVDTRTWDRGLLTALGLPEKLFLPMRKPGTVLGSFSEAVKKELGFDCRVVMVPSHDTASAMLAVPDRSGSSACISSGTWSLLGVERAQAICTEQCRLAGFTNEGGYDLSHTVVKNIMGLWMIQSVRHELGKKHSYAELCELAEAERGFPSRVNVDDIRFFAPASMIRAIQDACREAGDPVPETPGQLATVVYRSLAECYARSIRDLEAMIGSRCDAVNIVGGGSNADYLNRLTAEATGLPVYAGPAEATAIGNIVCQMLTDGVFATREEAKDCIFTSFSVQEYLP